MKDNEEYEFVVFEDKVGVIVKTTDADVDRKVKNARQLLKDISKNNKTVVEEIEAVPTSINIDEIARKIGIDETKLRELFDIGQNKIYLLGDATGTNASDKVKNASLMILTLYDYIFGRAMKTTELREALKNAGLPLENLGTILKEERSLIIRIGKPKSPNMEYRLTQPGKREGLKLIFQHIGITDKQKTPEMKEVNN